MRFKVVITYDSEYGGYVVDVPELVGCMSQGKTIDEALSNIKDAIKGWLEVEKNMEDRIYMKIRRFFLGRLQFSGKALKYFWKRCCEDISKVWLYT